MDTKVLTKMKSKAIFNWSSGKDSAFALYKIMNSNQFEIISLITSINEKACLIKDTSIEGKYMSFCEEE